MEWLKNILVPLLGVFAAFFAVWYQVRNQRRALGVEILLKLVETFFKDMREERCAAANVIPNVHGDKWNGDEDEAEDVLDFFNLVGLLVRNGTLDKKLVWHEFFYWVYGYYDRAQDHIQKYQQIAPVVWEDLSWLYQGLVKIERGKRGDIDETEWVNFVNEEKKTCGAS